MREIKFRGIRLDGGEWIYGGLWINKTATRETAYIIDNDGNIHIVDANTVGQYTGLTDCKGIDIYDGDMVEMTCFYIEDTQGNSIFPITNNYKGEHDMQSIYKVGNIHEYSEPLETSSATRD